MAHYGFDTSASSTWQSYFTWNYNASDWDEELKPALARQWMMGLEVFTGTDILWGVNVRGINLETEATVSYDWQGSRNSVTKTVDLSHYVLSFYISCALTD